MRHARLLPLVIASLVTGCGPLAAGLAPRKAAPAKSTGTVVASPSAAPSLAPGATGVANSQSTTGGAGIIANNGAGIALNGGSLVGHFSAPATLISDNGGGIIANNGGNVVGNNGGSYRLTSLPSQQPLAGVVVHLLDAAGKPVTGSDGKPLTATTDAKGAYVFAAALPAHNLLVEASLPGSKGVVRAVVPRDGMGQKVVEADLVSSLTTGYILSQYVRSQSDPDTVFERLPADVERQTREKAAAAVAAADQTPDSLQDADVVKTVDSLRQHDADLNGQMETVKKLLVVAGASDLGSGTKGTDVSLRGVDGLAAGADGAVFILTRADRRIWRLRPDGILETAVGSTTPPTGGTLDGQVAVDAALDTPTQIAADAQGRLLFIEARGMFRLEPDGHLKALGTVGSGSTAIMPGGPSSFEKLIAPGPAGGALVTTIEDHPFYAKLPGVGDQGYGYAYVLSRLADGGAATPLMFLHTDPFDYGEQTFALAHLAWDGKTTAYAIARSTGSTDATPPAGWQLLKLDLAAGTDQAVTTFGAVEPNLDTSGDLYALDASGNLTVKQLFPDKTVPVTAPANYSASFLAVGSDGKVYAASGNEVFRLDAGGPVRVVGNGEQPGSSNALAFFFQTLGGLVQSPDGLLVADTGTAQIYRLDANQQIVPYLKTPDYAPSILRFDPAGKLHAPGKDASEIGTVDAQGAWTLATKVPGLAVEFLYGPDGTLYYTNYDLNARTYQVTSVKDGQTTQLLSAPVQYALALDASGKLLVAGDGALRRQAASGFDVVKADPAFDLPRDLADGQVMAVDAKGRVYLARVDQHTIVRYDPAADAVTTLAGVGGKLFTGNTVDAGIKHPCRLVFGPKGDLYFEDTENRQVKFIGASDL